MAKVLIVDDSETLRVQLRKDLEGAGHQVIEGSDGVDGLNKLKEVGKVDLILCDVNMPNMDGLTMCSKVSQDPNFKGTPIFMLTTEANPEMKAKAKDFGVRAWITKPYVAAKLVSAIDKIAPKV